MPRFLRRSGRLSVPPQSLRQIGLDRDATLFPNDQRIFEGFDLLREYFMFPRKFLGCKLTGLGAIIAKLAAKTIDIVFAFDEVNTRLAPAVQPSMFALYAAPAINLFGKTADRIQLKSNQHEYHIVPDRSHYLDYEPHQLLDVYAHYAGGGEKVPVTRRFIRPHWRRRPNHQLDLSTRCAGYRAAAPSRKSGWGYRRIMWVPTCLSR